MNIIPTKVVHVIRRICISFMVVAGLSLTACGTSTSSGGRVNVVASTNVWGEIAREIGGDRVDVTSFISNPSADPHSYEADAQNQLALSKADVVIENGGGYDDFMATMLSASGSKATVINAVSVSGKKPGANGDLNEHVWYDFAAVKSVATEIEKDLAAADPAGRATYEKNLRTFLGALNALAHRAGMANETSVIVPVGITEPVPVYLLDSMGLRVITPHAFSKAIEEGAGVPVLVMQQVRQQISNHQIKALVYNAQTSGAETSQVLAAARASHVPVVPVTETIPAGMTYISWMTSQINAIGKAVQ